MNMNMDIYAYLANRYIYMNTSNYETTKIQKHMHMINTKLCNFIVSQKFYKCQVLTVTERITFICIQMKTKVIYLI